MSPGWKINDFIANFNDQDNSGGSGIAKSFYQVLFFDGNFWKANPNNGFYTDNFDGNSIDALWTVEHGNWLLTANNKLEQIDKSEYNSNIYDAQGRLVLKSNIDQSNTTLDVSELSDATYRILIQVDQQFIVKEFIKH
ncbi:T9SS type A sorting domain-containing protein [Brumimicrobium salinarum]|uniref:T9SS type A sorting domain-containing protein n=1 Tax=Brumimicrobium salinarum TaxID=2058658 RepID=UPI0013FD4E8C|nr:T9SS type A sorting domain-containing protein [Brumimicrobium salinarum]